MPQTRLISVCDREADFFELFDEQRHNDAVHLLIRAKQERQVKKSDRGSPTDDALFDLFEVARQAPIQSEVIVNLSRQAARTKRDKLKARPFRSARKAQLTIRAIQVQLQPPKSLANKDPVNIWILHAKEENPPQGENPVEWYLLTTMPILHSSDAEQCLRWYCLRWRIEDWHRVLKSGCRIEKLAHKTAERLCRAIAINLVIGWRIMLMTLLGREQPELSAEVLFSDVELRVLHAHKKKSLKHLSNQKFERQDRSNTVIVDEEITPTICEKTNIVNDPLQAYQSGVAIVEKGTISAISEKTIIVDNSSQILKATGVSGIANSSPVFRTLHASDSLLKKPILGISTMDIFDENDRDLESRNRLLESGFLTRQKATSKGKKSQPKTTNHMTLGEAVRLVAKLGGYLGRNSDPPPGHQVIWNGYIALQHMCTLLDLLEPIPIVQ